MVKPPFVPGLQAPEPVSAFPAPISRPPRPGGARAPLRRVPHEQHIEYVGFWARVGATLIDTVLVLAATLPLLLWLYGPDYFGAAGGRGGLPAGPADVLISWVAPTLAAIGCWMWRQATPGKMLLSARILDASTGRPPTLGQCLVRYFAYLVALAPLGLGLLWVAFDRRKQGWHDKLAGTVVIRPRRGDPESGLPGTPA